MALISPESLERVKQTADIVEVISAHTDLRRQGTRWVGLCPFHEERTPSFSVDAQERLYHCFGCGVGGDTIKFVEEKEGLGFAEAVELLAERYGVELEREQEDPRAEARREQRRRLEQLLDRTAAFYATFLWDAEEAQKARDYMAGRGLGEEVLRAFGVGYAPSAWDQVLLRGQRAGFKVDELRGVGLAQRGRGEASTTASARGSCSRSATAAAAPSASAAGRCAPTRGRSTSTPRRPTSSTRARCSTGSIGRRARSPRPAGRWSSRDIRTCSPCTRRGSRRRSG